MDGKRQECFNTITTDSYELLIVLHTYILITSCVVRSADRRPPSPPPEPERRSSRQRKLLYNEIDETRRTDSPADVSTVFSQCHPCGSGVLLRSVRGFNSWGEEAVYKQYQNRFSPHGI